MSQKLMSLVEKTSLKEDMPRFEIGDTVDVHCRILEGEKERIRGTRNVGKSKPCSFEIRTEEVLPAFEKVMRYKLGSK